MSYQFNITYAREQDQSDELKKHRSLFYFPIINNKPSIYFTGNSLGLQPKSTQDYVLKELEDWATHGVEGHLLAKNPWYAYHEMFAEPVAKIVGANPNEVVIMNQLTSNLHFLMVSFYQPTKQRYKIICEAKAFPSDQYAIESQVKFHGFNPDEAIIEVHPKVGEHTLRTEDILSTIEKHKNELALVLFGGVNYLTGQYFELDKITAAAQNAGAYAGYDLAHAAGNIKLELHNWNVDFACWCTYKYLNSGPGCVGGAFVHEKHHNSNLPRFAGWWGHNKATRFKMEKGFDPIPTAEAWQLSNAPVIAMACHKASIDIFNEVGMDALCKKRNSLTGYLEYVIEQINTKLKTKSSKYFLEIITPKDINQRGCQLSIIAHGLGKELHNKLLSNGVICDWREPNVVRCAPAPLYNSFEDVFCFGEILLKLLEQ